ncbi:MAG: hypothetical protein ACT4RN_06825 [Pseudonocardia sp.]
MPRPPAIRFGQVWESPREPIVDAGTAHLDRLTWVTTTRLVELVAELHPDRHVDVAQTIRSLIGDAG